MKRLTCEVCGSTDMIKKDGLFECQSCGCKYSIEEVRKMMIEGTVEVTGTVKVDNSDAIVNYLKIAKSALEGGNMKDAEDYCKKILEMDTEAWEAWLIRGKAVGWQSTLAASRLQEVVHCFNKVIDLCPEDLLKILKDDCKKELQQINETTIQSRVNLLFNLPTTAIAAGLRSDLKSIDQYANTFLKSIGQYSGTEENLTYARIISDNVKQAWDIIYQNYDNANGGWPLSVTWNSFVSAGDALINCDLEAIASLGTRFDDAESNDLIISIYQLLIAWQGTIIDSCSWTIDVSGWSNGYVKDYELTKEAKKLRREHIQEYERQIRMVTDLGKRNVATRKEQERIAKERRIQAYWTKHAEEKEALENEHQELHNKVTELKKTIYAIPEAMALREVDKKIKETRMEMEGYSIFQRKEKKQCQEKLEDMNYERNAMLSKFNQITAPHKARIDGYSKRMAEIENELTKDRDVE